MLLEAANLIDVLKNSFSNTLMAKRNNQKQYLPLAGTNTVSDLTAVGSVVHEEKFHILLARNKQFLEAVWKSVSGLMILFATNSWHLLETSISSSGEAINTSDSSVGIGL